jgi:hypothetical protein
MGFQNPTHILTIRTPVTNQRKSEITDFYPIIKINGIETS